MKNAGQMSIDEYLKLQLVSERMSKERLTDTKQVKKHNNLSFHNKYSFMKKVDDLLTGPGWNCELITVTGNVCDEDGEMMKDILELWCWDPVEIVHDLIGNPAFKDYMAYTLEKTY
jgi:hypothetical protein